MLLSPISYVPSHESGDLIFRFRTPNPEAKSTNFVFIAVFAVAVLLTAFFTALSTPGFWGQGIGKTSLSSFEQL